jgi:pimeloyl-ACP methyl ester carboxylesterase
MSSINLTQKQKIIHFAHANGFPTASYQKLFAQLDKRYRVIAPDMFAHNPHYPLNDNWSNQIDELISVVETHANGQKVIALGHSFGAVVSYMSACKRPDLFSGLIMLDPPLITGIARYVFRFAKRNRLINKITPAGVTQNRVRKWKSNHDLTAYFAQKKLFAQFDKDCIEDYVNAVMVEQAGNMTLRFDVETEANIFRTIPHNLPTYAGKLKVPAVLMTARNSHVCVPVLYKPFLRGNPSIKHQLFDNGTHMFPFEYPNELGAKLAPILDAF